MKTAGNTIFISGGSAGIGLAIAKKLSQSGNTIIINGRNEERLQSALKELDNAAAIQGDLSIEADRIRIAKQLKEEYSKLYVQTIISANILRQSSLVRSWYHE